MNTPPRGMHDVLDNEIHRYPAQSTPLGFSGIINIQIPTTRLMEVEAKDNFVGYSLEYHTILDNYKKGTGQVYRRFKDFSWLNYNFEQKYPICIIPPFPDKQMLKYFDRFQEAFVERRRISLERYLGKVCLHPVLQKSEELRYFLECDFLPSSTLASYNPSSTLSLDARPEPGFLERLGEKILGSFSKTRHPNEKYEKIKQELSRSSEVLRSLYSYQKNISSSYQATGKYSHRVSEIYDQLSEVIDPELKDDCCQISQVMANVRFYDEEFSVLQYNNFQLVLKEVLRYISNAKELIDRRNRRQLDYEEISEYVKELNGKRDLIKGSPVEGGASSDSTFWKRRISYMTGSKETDQKEKMSVVDAKIQEGVAALSQSHDELEMYNSQIERELDFFKGQKLEALRLALKDYTEFQLSYNTKCLNSWKSVLNSMETNK